MNRLEFMNTGDVEFEVPEEIKALLPEQKLQPLVQAFTQLDANQDGKIDLDEYFEFALAAERMRLTNRFETLDQDKDGYISFEEFVIASEPNFQILKKFRELDLNRNGLLSVEEAIAIANQLVIPLNPEQIQTLMEEVDRNGDGQLTYYEYLGAIAHIGFQ